MKKKIRTGNYDVELDAELLEEYSYENTIESIIYYPLGSFETEEEMNADYDDMREDFFSAEDLDVLFSDIPGDAG